MQDIAGFVRHFSISAIPLLLAITFHEAAHGYVAWKKGDPTAKMLGRVTLNPLAHVDPVGTVLFPAFLIFVGSPFLFGWAKPVPVNFRLLEDQKRAPIYVAAAGVVTNLALAAASGILFRSILLLAPDVVHDAGAMLSGGASGGGAMEAVLLPVALMCVESVRWNVILCLFNLIPIPPLDGGRIAVGLLPPRASMALASVERYGMLILIGLMMFDPFGIIWRIIDPLRRLLLWVFLGA